MGIAAAIAWPVNAHKYHVHLRQQAFICGHYLVPATAHRHRGVANGRRGQWSTQSVLYM